jgi:hypothetical protein
MNTRIFHARRPLRFAILAAVGALFALASPAHADAWLAFDDKPGTINLSTDSQNPSIVNQVTVVCPQNGFLVATSTATAFMRNLTGGRAGGSVVFSISREMRRDEVYDAVVVQNLGPNTFADIPATVQRIEPCTAGETVTYYHTAHGFAGEGNQVATEGHVRLVVEFFNVRI